MEKYRMNGKGGYLQTPVCDKTVVTEISGDFTLPDYQPEIKRLLRVGATVLPPSKYIGDKEAEFAGGIDYYVLYTGSDNQLYCAPLTSDYKISLPMERGDKDEYRGESTGDIVTVADTVSGRVTAPRKISIKCRLRSRVRVFGEMAIEDSFGEGDDSLRVLKGELCASKMVQGSEMIRVSDEMICDNKDADLRVIMAEGKVMMSDVSTGNDNVFCRGEIYLKLLLCKDEEDIPYTVTKKIPFSGNVPLDGATPEWEVVAKGSVSEMNVTVDEGVIGIEIGMIVEALACAQTKLNYIKDVYSIARKTENQYKNVGCASDGTVVSGNFTLSDSITLDECGIAHRSRVIDICGTAFCEEYSFERDKCLVGGRAKFSVLTEKDGEYSVADIELPFSYRAPQSVEFDGGSFSADVVSGRARLDGERIGIDAEICISGHTLKTSSQKMLSGVGFGELDHRNEGEYILCYPSPSDDLWSIAKRYCAPVERVAEVNGIKGDVPYDSQRSIEGANFLLI